MKRLSQALTMVAALVLVVGAARADGIVNTVVNSPLSAAGTVKDAKVGINVYLQQPDAPGADFMDPAVIGYGVAPGGRIEIEMAEGFERDMSVPLSQAAIMVVTGAPQQGLPGKKIGYKVSEGENDKTFVITPTAKKGLPAGWIMSPAPGAKGDAIRQRGIKVFHIGFLRSPFINRGAAGIVHVRFIDGKGKVKHEGRGRIPFLSGPVAQIQPTNFPDKRRNHNWQRVKSGDILGKTPGTVPVTLMLYARAKGVAPDDLVKFKGGIAGAGVLSTQQLKAMGYAKPDSLKRYNGGLIVQDSNGDGRLDPRRDRIIGGVIGKAPKGARGQELRSPEQDGKPLLSRPSAEVIGKPGKRWGGAIMQLQFTAGDKPGKYRPTLALLRDPKDPSRGNGSEYTYTIVVE